MHKKTILSQGVCSPEISKVAAVENASAVETGKEQAEEMYTYKCGYHVLL